MRKIYEFILGMIEHKSDVTTHFEDIEYYNKGRYLMHAITNTGLDDN